MVRKPLVQPAKDITASKDSIYSDEKQSQFLEGDTLALPIEAENAYSLDRSTPLSALKQMMREHYSPNTLLDNSVASAIVLAVTAAATIPSTIPINTFVIFISFIVLINT